MKTESVIYGTFILIITNTLVKLMSLVYRSATIRLIGAEGLGLTEMMTPFYSLLIVIASLGIPPAMANQISSASTEANTGSILKTATLLLCVSGGVLTALTCLSMPFFGDYAFPDQRIIPGFYVLVPSVFLISLFSALRGYFQGTHQTSFIGRSQVVEQLIRIAAGISILSFLVHDHAPLPLLIVGVAAASLAAEAGGGIYLWKKYRRQRIKTKSSFDRSAARKMLRSGMSITLSRLILSVTTALQAAIVPHAMIQMGASQSEAAAFFGLFSGVALTVLHLPSVITGALITPLIPAIADSDCRNHALRNRRISKSLLFTNITALPILALLYYFAKEICAVLFAAPEAGPMLSLLCLGGIFLYLQQPVVGILQGMNRFSRIFVHYAIADVLYIAALLYLQYRTAFTVERFLLLFILNDVMIFALNYGYLKKITGFRINLRKAYFAPVIALAAGFIPMNFSYKQLTAIPLHGLLSMTLPALLFLLCYSFTLYLSGVIDKKAISSLLSLHKHR